MFTPSDGALDGNVAGTDALEVDGATIAFGDRFALNELSLRVARGSLTALLGPNGAGKTTLIRCCTGLMTPTAGTIRVLGHPTGSAYAAGRIGAMPQSTGAWSGIGPLELLGYLSRLYAHPQDVTLLSARLGIDRFARTPYRRLSGGQQQAVNLAGALIGRPELVFLDEPTAGMDPHARHATWDLLRELRAAGVTILLTTHAMDEAQELADYVYIVDAGHVAVEGTVRDLTDNGRSLEQVFLTSTRGGGTG